MTKIHKRISASIESVTGLRVKLKLVDPNTITRSEGKAKRVFDQRVK
jgi:phenylacetate-CoA ligase